MTDIKEKIKSSILITQDIKEKLCNMTIIPNEILSEINQLLEMESNILQKISGKTTGITINYIQYLEDIDKQKNQSIIQKIEKIIQSFNH